MVNLEDRIAKERLNIILLVDTSKSMSGTRIEQVNTAIKEIKDYLVNLQSESTNVDFYMTIITFSTEAHFYIDEAMIPIDKFHFLGLRCGGQSNLHLAYKSLGEILRKESKGGIMPDFGGAAPIILLLSDGHPTKNLYKEELANIKNIPWFKVALRYGVAIELDDKRTMAVLNDFVGNNGDVINCVDANKLKNIIKIIVLTASKVKSSNTNTSYAPHMTQNQQVQQLIAEALCDTENLEW